MEELLGRLTASAGIDRGTAEKSVAVIFNFLKMEGPADKVQALLDALPGAADVLNAAPGSGGGLFGGMGGIMGVGTQLMSLGLSMGQVQTVTREIIAFAREKAGEDAVGEIVGAIPGLNQFV